MACIMLFVSHYDFLNYWYAMHTLIAATWIGMRTNSRLTLIMECEEYLRDVPEGLIIPKESLKLMNAIGQGRDLISVLWCML